MPFPSAETVVSRNIKLLQTQGTKFVRLSKQYPILALGFFTIKSLANRSRIGLHCQRARKFPDLPIRKEELFAGQHDKGLKS